jgi:hypothetical protein
MDQYLAFAVAAIVLAALRYGTYFYTIYQGKTKPHAFTWLLWGTVTGVGTFAQFELQAGPAAWALGFVSVSCLLISAIAFFIGERNYTKSDWFALIGCFMAIPVWKATQNPALALCVIIVIDGLTYWPTIRKSFHDPQSEPPISAALAGLRYFLMLFAVAEPTWQTLMYPFFLMAADWGFALYIVIRRAQLGLPLHEYAKMKPAILQT